MLDAQLIRYALDLIERRLLEGRAAGDRGDVAEKIVIVGIFVIIAITVGGLITTAITHDATNIARNIAGAK